VRPPRLEDLRARLPWPPRPPGSGGDGAGPPDRRRRLISVISIALVVAGIGVIGYPFLTNLWQDRLQAKLGRQLTSRQLADAYRAHHLAVGDSLTRIKIPALGVNMVVVQGTTESALQAGAGHYVNTPLPCEGGNVAIAGHRTTYGKPFTNLDKLQPGDTIELDTPIGGCVYRVAQAPFVVAPTDISVLAATSVRTLTLTTCNPKGSAAQRLVVHATWNQDVKPV
jgi:sortase A